MRNTDKRNHIGFLLRLAHNLLEVNVKGNSELDGQPVTQIQHWIIHYLDKNQDRDVFQKDLEEEFHTSKATISSTLQVMERNGLITRTAVEWDARLKKLGLTEKALEFTRRARENVDKTEQLLRNDMTEEEVQELLRLLKQVCRNLEAGRCSASSCLENPSGKEVPIGETTGAPPQT